MPLHHLLKGTFQDHQDITSPAVDVLFDPSHVGRTFTEVWMSVPGACRAKEPSATARPRPPQTGVRWKYSGAYCGVRSLSSGFTSRDDWFTQFQDLLRRWSTYVKDKGRRVKADPRFGWAGPSVALDSLALHAPGTETHASVKAQLRGLGRTIHPRQEM